MGGVITGVVFVCVHIRGCFNFRTRFVSVRKIIACEIYPLYGSVINVPYFISGYVFAILDPETNVALSDEYFDHSQNTTLFGYPFYVEVTQLNYSMIIHVSVCTCISNSL